MSKNRYISTNTKTLIGNADTAHFARKMQDVTTINVIEQLRNKLMVGGIYQIRESYVDSGKYLRTRTTPMECIGIYPHMAVFRPTEGAHRHTVGYSYTELCQGVLEGVNDLMDGVLPYEEEELVDEEIENA